MDVHHCGGMVFHDHSCYGDENDSLSMPLDRTSTTRSIDINEQYVYGSTMVRQKCDLLRVLVYKHGDSRPPSKKQQKSCRKHRCHNNIMLKSDGSMLLSMLSGWNFTFLILIVLIGTVKTKTNNLEPSLYNDDDEAPFERRQSKIDMMSNDTVYVNKFHQVNHHHHQQLKRRRLTTTENTKSNNINNERKNRILYIITALSEYNTGTRNTVRGSDRLQETFIPVVSEGVRSMIQHGYTVDVYLVAHFILQPHRMQFIKDALPPNVGLDVWNDATPIGYDTGSNKPNRKLENRTLHLARQHRFVIKEKLLQYDIFVVFEDDMLITGDHVDHYVAVTNELRRLEELAPTETTPIMIPKENVLRQYYGTMTKGQLRRMIPGFMRVEVLTDETNYPAQTSTGPIPIDLQFTSSTTSSNNKPLYQTVNAKSCCYISDHLSNDNRPSQPRSDQLMIWETNILPLGVRQMPQDSWLHWVVLQRGPNQNDLNHTDMIGDYWSNRNKDYYGPKQRRPAPQEFKYINNMGGWMATREQLYVSWLSLLLLSIILGLVCNEDIFSH
jgi:hypothetical protein